MLQPTTFDVVAAHARGTHADGLVLSEAMATHWFLDGDGRGFVGIKEATAFKALDVLNDGSAPKPLPVTTITALFVHPTERGMGFGARILRDVMARAGNADVEIIADAPLHRWLGRFGFIAVRQSKKKSWLLRRPCQL